MNARTDLDAPSDMGPGVVAQGETPLHFAAICGDEEMITLMLDAGADKTIDSAKDETPLDFARAHNRPKTIIDMLK